MEEYLITIRFKKKSSSNLSNLNIEKKGNLFFILYSLISYVIINVIAIKMALPVKFFIFLTSMY